MAPTLSVVLSLGLCLGLGTGDKGTFSRPSLWAEPSPFIPMGTNVTLWCRGSARTKRYCLRTPRSCTCSDPVWPSGHGRFLLWPATKEDAGQYHCYYPGGSQSSHPLDLVLTGIHEKPSLWAQPGPSVATGENVTLRCRAKSGSDRFALYKDGVAGNATSFEWTSRADFLMPAAPGQAGTYRCYSFSSGCPHLWSAPSDPLKLSVVETSPRPGAPDDQAAPSGVLRLQEGILMGVSLLVLLFLFLFLFFSFHRQHWVRLETRGNEAEDNESPQSSSPAEAMQEPILYTAMKNSRQKRPEKPAAGDLQEVTYSLMMPLNPTRTLLGHPSHLAPHRSSSD